MAIEPLRCRLFYFHWTQPENWFPKRWYKLLYNTLSRWLVECNFSIQDGSMMFEQRYDYAKKLSGAGAKNIQWRKLTVTKQHGGRNAELGVEKSRAHTDI